MTNYLLCCDWGTSFFRLQLMDAADYRCLDEIQSPIGVADTFDNWRETGETMAREQFFRQHLSSQIALLPTRLSISLTNIPIVISGMASSSIGIEQIPYATLPFALDGSQAGIRHFDAQSNFPHDMLLISGVRSNDDVMRGEETQLIGLITLLDLSGHNVADAICIFPGTHSKHLCVRNRQLVQFDTYMTGELFDLMAKRSILKDSVDPTNLSNFSKANVQAFRQGIKQAKSSVIMNSLFKVRTNQLFEKLTKEENAFYLSGLLIGTELNHLVEDVTGALVLCGGSNLSAFYELAIDELNLTNRTLTIPTALIDRAASVGQIRLYQNSVLGNSVSR